MIVLALDTALDACAVAIVRDGETLASISEPMSRGQAERLAPMVREAIAAANIAATDIDRIAVTTGPGSFTGVRVGLSFARAFALALNKPCIGVSTLEALALSESEQGLRAAAIETPGASYVAFYDNAAPLIAPQNVDRDGWRAMLEEKATGRAFTTVGPITLTNVPAFAIRAARLDPALYPPNPTYLRAPHVTLPKAST